MQHDIENLKPEIDRFIQIALDEDVKDGDHSSQACIPENKKGRARLLVKDNGVLAGAALAEYIFRHSAPSVQFNSLIQDGAPIQKGDIAFTLEGEIRKILLLERLVLNCMQRMSGIATRTAEMLKLLEGTGTRLLDTRKTTPGIRFLEKWAVRIGGGHNHRFGLYDMIMLKDNHIDGAGGIRQAIEATQAYLKERGLKLKIEVETRNMDEVKSVMDVGGIDRIMLDNFTPAQVAEAVKFIGGKYETEASGGINESNMRSYAEAGVDYVSSSAMTHSVRSLDLSLKLY